MSDFKYNLRDFANDIHGCTGLLANYLNQGSLSLVIGAGVSKSGFGVPTWKDLVVGCMLEVDPSYAPQKDYTNSELKQIMDKVKSLANSSYLDIIKKKMYDGIDFDFKAAKKDLLIALTSLFIGKKRGNISKVITYNFDSILEWYLAINGLHCKVATFNNTIFSTADVEVLHTHGYIPHDPTFGVNSDEIVFTKKEFEDRMTGASGEYWIELMRDFYRKTIFLSVGLSPQSLIDDICPQLRKITSWRKQFSIKRDAAYGVAFLTSASKEEMDLLIDDGIIPCVLPVDEFATSIFSITKKALNL